MGDVDRVDRLLELIAELRAASPEPLDPAVLAARLRVSERTVRRDLEMLTHGGLPVRAEKGRGYVLPEPEGPAPLTEAGSLTGPVRDTLAEAVRTRRVVRLAYTDQAGARSFRDVEAHGLVIAPYGEYLVGWCRMRDGPRMFRLDRIGAAFLSGRGAEVRDLDELLAALRVPMPRPPAEPAPRGRRAPRGRGRGRWTGWSWCGRGCGTRRPRSAAAVRGPRRCAGCWGTWRSGRGGRRRRSGRRRPARTRSWRAARPRSRPISGGTCPMTHGSG
ncbi:WYL domain-containing protein [Actinomadura madurae]|nr:WYL domain-containing protein [Actinomadura madurae]MCP9947562.1 WYL domain-containing protein [Actinomadura madurae]MCP9964329.1 WYL domain-containing protein [Actinomadura madurae]